MPSARPPLAARRRLSAPSPPTGWGSLQGAVFTPKAAYACSLAIVTACYTEWPRGVQLGLCLESLGRENQRGDGPGSGCA